MTPWLRDENLAIDLNISCGHTTEWESADQCNCKVTEDAVLFNHKKEVHLTTREM